MNCLKQILRIIVASIVLTGIAVSSIANVSVAATSNTVDVKVYIGNEYTEKTQVGYSRLDTDTGIWHDQGGEYAVNKAGKYTFSTIAYHEGRVYPIERHTVTVRRSTASRRVTVYNRYTRRWENRWQRPSIADRLETKRIYNAGDYFGGKSGDELADAVRNKIKEKDSRALAEKIQSEIKATENDGDKVDTKEIVQRVTSSSPDFTKPIHINFGKPGNSLESYVQDTGREKQTQENGLRYGWNNDHSQHIVTRTNNEFDKTPIHAGVQGFAKIDKDIHSNLNWSINVPQNKFFEVEVITGDSRNHDKIRHHLLLNGKDLSDCTPNDGTNWCEHRMIINSGDGELRIEAGDNAKDPVINLVRIRPVL